MINSLNFVRDPSRTCLFFFLHSALFRQPFRQSSLWYSVQVLLPILNLENWFSFRINVNFITLVYDHFISISWPRQWCVILARWIFVFILLKRLAIVIVSIANTCLPYKGQVELIRAWEVFSQLLKECLWTLQIINYILNGFLIHYYA